MENADVFLGLQDFLERMRQPSAADLVKSIKSFIVSFSNHAPDPERDSALVQDFLAKMEAAFRAHPLWAGCSEEELDGAGEGLEKYVTTKLFTRVFASFPNDVKIDEQLSLKMSLIQLFIQPENLDIKPTFQNEASCLLAQKELQKINIYKAPRDKLVCILNCCKVINNLLLNASIASNHDPPGADDFLPVLIYVTIKANPPQLHSNLLYIQRYRHQSRLVGEAAYFLTNMLSVESFISNINAISLSMEETEFEKNMDFARPLLSGFLGTLDGQPDQSTRNNPRAEFIKSRDQSVYHKERDISNQSKYLKTRAENVDVREMKDESSMAKVPSISDIENKGAAMLLKEDPVVRVFQEYRYLYAHVGDLTINGVEDLLNDYKQLVLNYVCLSKGLGGATPSVAPSASQSRCDDKTAEETEDTAEEKKDESQELLGKAGGSISLVNEENVESKSRPDGAIAPQEEGEDATSS